MNKVLKVTLICCATNAVFILSMVLNQSGDTVIAVGLLWIAYLIVQLIFGTVLISQKEKRELGKGILLGMAISMLIGFSVCSSGKF